MMRQQERSPETERGLYFDCVCGSTIRVTQSRHSHLDRANPNSQPVEERWLPDPEAVLESNGWGHAGIVTGGRHRVQISPGVWGLVDAAPRVVELDRWYCSKECADRAARAIAGNREQHQVDTTKPEQDAASMAPKLSLADALAHPSPDERLTCSYRGCSDSIVVPGDPVRRGRALDAHGWQDGGRFCSRRCKMTAEAMAKEERRVAVPGPSAADMHALRERERQARERNNRGELPVGVAVEPSPAAPPPTPKRGRKEIVIP